MQAGLVGWIAKRLKGHSAEKMDGTQNLGKMFFILIAGGILLATPYWADFSFRNFTCALDPLAIDWWKAATNVKHLVSYSILFVATCAAFSRYPLWLTVAITFAITLSVELEQAFFNDGHCRLGDLIPNMIAIGLGLALIAAARFLLGRTAGARN